MIKAVLFDFDGTLINTNDLIFTSYRYAFKTVQNREISIEEMLQMYGRPLRLSLEKYGDDKEELYKVYRDYNAKMHDELIKKFDGAAEGVKKLKECGIKLAIVTSKRIDMLKKGIEFLGLTGYFDVLITPEDTKKHKPDPEPVLTACERLGVSPSEAVMVGDSVFDIKAGIAAGCKTCAVKYSLTDKNLLLDLGIDYFVDTISEFADKIINE